MFLDSFVIAHLSPLTSDGTGHTGTRKRPLGDKRWTFCVFNCGINFVVMLCQCETLVDQSQHGLSLDCSYMGQVIRCVNTYWLNSHCCLPIDICLVNIFETDAWTFILLGIYVPNAVYRLGEGGMGWGSHETWEESPVLQELVTKQWNLMVIGIYHLLCARPYAKSFYTYILI